LRDLSLPADVLAGVGQEPENGLRPCRDGDDLLNCLCVYGHDGSPFALPAPLPASTGAGSRPNRTQGRRAAPRCSQAAPDTGASCRSASQSPGPPPSARVGAARSPDGSRRSGGGGGAGGGRGGGGGARAARGAARGGGGSGRGPRAPRAPPP